MGIIAFGLVMVAIAGFVQADRVEAEIKVLTKRLAELERQYGKGDTWTTPQ